MNNTPRVSDKKTKGLFVVFTGNGKGKTSAAIGIMTRAVGQGLNVGVIQFIKSPDRIYGESCMASRLGIFFQTLGDGFVYQNPDLQEDSRLSALAAWNIAKEKIISHAFDLLILDEFTYPFLFKWLDIHEVTDWLQLNKPAGMHLVITGRYAPPELIEIADLVTEMREIKHPYRTQGLPAQPGIDY